MPFTSEKKTVAGEGSDGAAYQQLAAARVEASNEGKTRTNTIPYGTEANAAG